MAVVLAMMKLNTIVYNTIDDCSADFVCVHETNLLDINNFKAAKLLPPIYNGLAVQPSNIGGLLIA